MTTDSPPQNGTKELTGHERVALVVWALAHGEGVRTCDAVRMTGLSKSAAIRMLQGLARVIPIYQDDNDIWVVCYLRESNCTN